MFLFYVTTWWPTRYAIPEPMPGRSVDVFITTYNEPVDLVRETVMCAVNMTYPHKTYILDDGKRPEMQQLAQEFGCGWLTRPEHKFAKAGNLNNGLAHTSGEFIVTLDADHVPSPDLIEQLIGFFRDPKVGGIQTNQDFYNLDSFQHRAGWASQARWQQQELFFNVVQPGKDRYNAAFFCGSPGMMRRAALEDIGGFAIESVTEDMHTGMRMQKKGWRMMYHNKTLAVGLAPQTYLGFANQWRRWGNGNMQVLRFEKPFSAAGLRLGQRVMYFASTYFYWMSYQKLLYLMTPIVALLFGIFPLVATPRVFVEFFFPYFFLNLYTCVLLQGGFTGYVRSEEFNVLKMHVLMQTIQGLFPGFRKMKFKVTPKSQAKGAGPREMLVPLTMCVLMAAALIVGTWRLVRTSDVFYIWAFSINLFWCAFHLFLMAGVVMSSMRRKELRHLYRFPVHLNTPVIIRYKGLGGEPIEVKDRARDLNRSGLAVALDDPVSAKTPVELELRLSNLIVHASGEVVHNRNVVIGGKTRVAVGIQFTKIDDLDRDAISKYLFWQIAPREMSTLQLTYLSQREV
jgi:cellulose synthase (UDP-forming)